MNKIYFVGGYYKACKINNDEEVINDIFDCPEIFDIESVMKLGFVNPVSEDYEDNAEQDSQWWELGEMEQIKLIMDYTKHDELAGLILCDSLDKANEVLRRELQRILDLEEEFEITSRTQTDNNNYIDVYTKKEVRKVKLMVSKASGNASTNSLNWKTSVPNAWISVLGATKENRDITMTLDSKNKEITLKKVP